MIFPLGNHGETIGKYEVYSKYLSKLNYNVNLYNEYLLYTILIPSSRLIFSFQPN